MHEHIGQYYLKTISKMSRSNFRPTRHIEDNENKKLGRNLKKTSRNTIFNNE